MLVFMFLGDNSVSSRRVRMAQPQPGCGLHNLNAENVNARLVALYSAFLSLAGVREIRDDEKTKKKPFAGKRASGGGRFVRRYLFSVSIWHQWSDV